MLDPVFDFFEKLITAFTWRRLLLIISLIGMALAGFVVYEYYTGHFRLGRIERAASALEHLAKLEPSLADRNNQTLSNTLKGLENDLHGYVTFSSTPFNLPEPALKFLAAIVIWASRHSFDVLPQINELIGLRVVAGESSGVILHALHHFPRFKLGLLHRAA